MSLFLKALGFFLLSTFKFAVSIVPILMVFDYYTALLISISGGIFGVFFFMFLWNKVIEIWGVLFPKTDKPSKPIKMNRRRRNLVKIKNKYGYWGLVITTPAILSIPVGVFIVVNYFQYKKYKFLHLSLSVVVWGVLLISFFSLF